MDVDTESPIELEDTLPSELQYKKNVNLFHEMLERLRYGHVAESERHEFRTKLRAVMRKICKGVSDNTMSAMIKQCDSLNIS